VAGNPADLALIRMQSDGLKPLAERANYKGVFDALGRIARQEGVGALWSGAAPTVVRAMALNFGQLAFFSEAKVRLQGVGALGPRTKTLTGEWQKMLFELCVLFVGFFAFFFACVFVGICFFSSFLLSFLSIRENLG